MADSVRDLVIDFDARLDEVLERLERIEAAVGRLPASQIANTFQNPDTRVDTKEAAKILGVAPSTLYKDAMSGAESSLTAKWVALSVTGLEI